MIESTARILTPDEAAALDVVAQPFVAAAMAEARRLYPDFDAWTDDAQFIATVATCVQTLLRPSVHVVQRLNLDNGAYGVGLALGHAFAAVGGVDLDYFNTHVLRGIAIGRQATLDAAAAMPTTGSRQ